MIIIFVFVSISSSGKCETSFNSSRVRSYRSAKFYVTNYTSNLYDISD